MYYSILLLYRIMYYHTVYYNNSIVYWYNCDIVYVVSFMSAQYFTACMTDVCPAVCLERLVLMAMLLEDATCDFILSLVFKKLKDIEMKHLQ